MNYDDRLRHALKLAEQRFGARVYADTIPAVTFHDGPPSVLFSTPTEIVIRLSLRCEHDYLRGCYQLAHETVHLLSPVNRRAIITLEEGLAELFAHEYVRGNIGLEVPHTADPRYNQAMALVERFLAPRGDAIVRMRQREPVISRITKELIEATYPEVPSSLSLLLVTPFYALSSA